MEATSTTINASEFIFLFKMLEALSLVKRKEYWKVSLVRNFIIKYKGLKGVERYELSVTKR